MTSLPVSRVVVLDLLARPCARHTSEEIIQSRRDAGSANARALEAAPISGAPQAEVLTRRDREVLEPVTQGYLNREIADRLALSEGSIETHIRLPHRKLDVSTRAEAARWGEHHGAGC